MKPKVFKAISSGLVLLTLTSMVGSVSPVNAATTNLWTWGSNTAGQLGRENISYYTEPVRVGGLTQVKAIEVGRIHSLALKSDGTVWVWGNNSLGQLGDGTTTFLSGQFNPVQAKGLTGVVAVAGGLNFVLALKADGTVWAWGQNNAGQLGNNATAAPGVSTPVQTIGLTGVVGIAGGGSHSLAVKLDGTVWAWGQNNVGLGDGTTINSLTPVQVSGLTSVVAVAAGWNHSLALKSDGTVWAWGDNGFGQLGDGTTVNRTTPVQVHGFNEVIAIGTHYNHTLALKADGTVWAWGSNDFGQLGDGTTENRYSPVMVNGLTGVVKVIAAKSHSMVIKSDGTVWSWGQNNFGQLGIGNTVNRQTPGEVVGLRGVVDIRSFWEFSLALKEDSAVWGWGQNNFGQLGFENAVGSPLPLVLEGITGVAAANGAASYTLALKADGTVWAWGNNENGVLGDNTKISRNIPAPVMGLDNVISIEAGSFTGVAAKADGTVWTWGRNSGGQIGDGTTIDRLTPVQVSGLTGVVSVCGGHASYNLALKSDGTVWTWGQNNFGQLGDGTTTNRLTPVPVSGLTGAVAIVGAQGHSLALKSDGTVWAWGLNNAGQLGDGTTIDRLTPIQVDGLKGIIAIGGFSYFSLALKADGTVWAWGQNANGQLGDGTTIDRLTPVQVSGLTGVVTITAGFQHSLALKSDGTVWAWGDNTYGQLGIIAAQNSTSPVQVAGLTGIAAIGAGRNHNMAIQSPDAPSLTGASPAAGATEVPTNIAIGWAAVPFANYDFQLSTSANFTPLTINITNSTNHSYKPTSVLLENTTYYWRVRSRLGRLTSPWTTAMFTTASPFAPTVVTALQVPIRQQPAQSRALPAPWIIVFVAAGLLFASILFVVKVRTAKMKLATNGPNEILLSAGDTTAININDKNSGPKDKKYSIRVKCFGEFKVSSDSGQIDLWRNKPAKLAFEYLVVKYGNPVTKDALMEVLWPGGLPEASSKNLKMVIYQVRDTLKPLFDSSRINPILFKEGRYLLNPDIDIIVDFIEFERHWKQGKKLEKEGKSAEAKIEYEKAAGLYPGDFLEEELYQEWTIPYRESFKDIYMLLTDKLSEIAVASGDYVTCIEYCHKILAKDECREDVYRKLMKCYNQLGQNNNALKWYEKCLLTMQNELGTQPSADTESLHKRILNGEKI